MGRAPPLFLCHVTFTYGPADDEQSTSIDSPGFKYDLDGSNWRNGRGSAAIRLGIDENKLVFLFCLSNL